MDPTLIKVDGALVTDTATINCDLDFFSTIENAPDVIIDASLSIPKPESTFQDDIDDFFEALVSNNDSVEKQDNFVNENSSDLTVLANENLKLKKTIREFKLVNIKQESELANCEQNLAEKWIALESVKSELHTVKDKNQALETENIALKFNVTQLELVDPG
ncbi:hypothetical protein JTE90_014731 [Oedothorax gibbosus]|uniref:Uncharacterized protein n=1 Tax=Oedothorax gibbosus TaxID=931172 RepID=A0AAV6UQY4_9ARAC|nr:hypothetical protein JTE90_014731 [Oedothorax gibbosus]